MDVSWSTCWCWCLPILALGTLAYLAARHRYGYWSRRGVFSPPATFPAGHIGDVALGRTQIGVKFAQIYEAHKHRPHLGIFMFATRAWLVNDLDLIRSVLVKDFTHFVDHGLAFDKHVDPLSNHLFNMTGNEWRAVRAKLSPTFTSNKMKYMFGTFVACADEMIEHLSTELVDRVDEVDVKELLAKYGTDVIGSCAFGVDTNSFKHPDAEFRRMGRKIFESDAVRSFKEVMTLYAPAVVKALKIRLVSRELEDFFTGIVEQNIRYRIENGVVRNDFLQLLLDMQRDDEKKGVKHMTLLEMTAQVYLFFLAGFETSATTSSFALYELAKNPDVQEKLREEIDEVTRKHNGAITYESVHEMEYLNQVIEETLRMYPPLPFLFRLCVKDYPIDDTVIEKGTMVIIPSLGIHMDPNIHADPQKFNPDRYAPENKQLLNQYASLGFGEGPRMCIGNRFGLMQTRLGLVSILSKFEVSVSKSTQIPCQFDKKSFTMTTLTGPYLKVSRRKI